MLSTRLPRIEIEPNFELEACSISPRQLRVNFALYLLARQFLKTEVKFFTKNLTFR